MERYEEIKKVIKDSQGIVNSKFLKENDISNYYINKLLKDKLIEREYSCEKEEDFEEYRLSTIGDGRVCPICRGLESETFRIKDRQPGVNFPPLHTWCRCTFTIEVKDWNTWMKDYERRHGNGQAEKVADSLRDRSVEEAKDKDGVYTELWNLSKDIIERSLQINNFLTGIHYCHDKFLPFTTAPIIIPILHIASASHQIR